MQLYQHRSVCIQSQYERVAPWPLFVAAAFLRMSVLLRLVISQERCLIDAAAPDGVTQRPPRDICLTPPDNYSWHLPKDANWLIYTSGVPLITFSANI